MEIHTSGPIIFSDGRLSYIGQDVHRIPSVLAKLYGSRVHTLDLSYNALTSLQELPNFSQLTELILDNNQLDDGIMFPIMNTLHTLSLNKNLITNLDALLMKIETKLPNLRFLSLLGNIACPNQLSDLDKDEEDYQRYRYYVIYHLPGLQFLDSRPVSNHEKSEAMRTGKFMKVVRPSPFNSAQEVPDAGRKSTPLPNLVRSANDHQDPSGAIN